MTYTNIGLVKGYLGITGESDDGLINGMIAYSDSLIDRLTDRTFEVSADTTRYFDAIGDHIRGLTLHFDDYIASITTVTNGDGSTVSSSQYTTIPKNDSPYTAVRLLSNAGLTWTYSTEWMDAISVTGKWGYSVTTPNEVEHLATRLSSWLYRQKDNKSFDTVITTDAIIQPAVLPGDIKQMIATLRRPG